MAGASDRYSRPLEKSLLPSWQKVGGVDMARGQTRKNGEAWQGVTGPANSPQTAPGPPVPECGPSDSNHIERATGIGLLAAGMFAAAKKSGGETALAGLGLCARKSPQSAGGH